MVFILLLRCDRYYRNYYCSCSLWTWILRTFLVIVTCNFGSGWWEVELWSQHHMVRWHRNIHVMQGSFKISVAFCIFSRAVSRSFITISNFFRCYFLHLEYDLSLLFYYCYSCYYKFLIADLTWLCVFTRPRAGLSSLNSQQKDFSLCYPV